MDFFNVEFRNPNIMPYYCTVVNHRVVKFADDVTEIDISNLNITGIDCELPPSVVIFNCGCLNLDSVPKLPSTLEVFACYGNNLTSLPVLPITLKELACNGNNLTEIDLSNNLCLQVVSCAYNQIKDLVFIPPSVKELHCSHNNLKRLPTLPPKLEYLDCSDNELTSIPTLPPTLTFFDCSTNQLVRLPTLPESLEEFNCNVNKIEELPDIPETVKELYCANNCLTIIRKFHKNLTLISCECNALTSLDGVEQCSLLEYIDFSHNKLTQEPTLPINIEDNYDDICNSYNIKKYYTEIINSDKECVICHEQTTDAVMLNSSCKHIFCKECINKWLSIKSECPTCRADLMD